MPKLGLKRENYTKRGKNRPNWIELGRTVMSRIATQVVLVASPGRAGRKSESACARHRGTRATFPFPCFFFFFFFLSPSLTFAIDESSPFVSPFDSFQRLPAPSSLVDLFKVNIANDYLVHVRGLLEKKRKTYETLTQNVYKL